MLYALQDRRFVGASIGYFKFVTLEVFEDKALADRECTLLRRNDPGSYARVITLDSVTQ